MPLSASRVIISKDSVDFEATNSFSTDTTAEAEAMVSPWTAYGACLAACLGFSWLFAEPSFLSQLGLFCLVVVLTNVVYRLVMLVLPRDLLPNLERRAVLVTGCSSGFGHALALRLDSLGVPVYAGCRNIDAPGVKALKAAASSRLKVVCLDITKQDSIDKAVDVVRQDLGEDRQLWAVVNNAGIAYTAGIEWCSNDMLRQTIDTNTFGAVEVTRAFLPLLRNNLEGRVVTTVSVAAHLTLPLLVANCMSKHALVSFVNGLRMELAHWGITVHEVEPTIYRTPISDNERLFGYLTQGWESASPEVREAYGESYLNACKDVVSVALSLFKRPASKTGEIVDALVDAAVGANPQDMYVPGFVGQIHRWFADYAPQCLLDFVVRFVFLRQVPDGVKKLKEQRRVNHSEVKTK